MAEIHLVKPNEIEPLESFPTVIQQGQFVWVNLKDGIENALEWLTSNPFLAPDVIDSLCQEKTRPRQMLTADDGQLLMLSCGVKNERDELSFITMRIYASEHIIVTVSSRALEATAASLQGLKKKSGIQNTTMHLVYRLMKHVLNTNASYVEELDEAIITLEDAWDDSHILDNETLMQLRRLISKQKRYLGPQLDAITRMSESIEDIQWLDLDVTLGQAKWRDRQNAVRRDIEVLNEMTERLSILRDTQEQITAEQTQKTMMILSLVATFFLPMTLIASLLGMNVAGIPGASWSYSFLSVCVIMVLVGAIQWIAFKRLKWLK